MTGQASTSFFGRVDADGHALPRSAADLAMLGAFYLLNAPFLLRSLYGGSARAKRALLQRLNLPSDALPAIGSWKADVGLLNFLADYVMAHQPSTIVEFSTGASTLITARAMQVAGLDGATLTSFEQHEDFCATTSRWLMDFGLHADIRHAPLRPAPGGWPGLWYDHGPLPQSIDLLIVDGPHWAIHPFTRGAAATIFDRLSIGGAVVLDDALRPGERIVARRWRRLFPNMRFTLLRTGSKGTLLGTRFR